MAHVADITPVVPVSDLTAAVGFFRDTLGFTVTAQSDDFAYLRLGGGALRLISAAGAHVHMDDPAQQQGIYVDTDGLDALFARLQPGLPPDDLLPPFDQPYGQREFHVYYEGLQIIFGETRRSTS